MTMDQKLSNTEYDFDLIENLYAEQLLRQILAENWSSLVDFPMAMNKKGNSTKKGNSMKTNKKGNSMKAIP
jgi:hypothetical protein